MNITDKRSIAFIPDFFPGLLALVTLWILSSSAASFDDIATPETQATALTVKPYSRPEALPEDILTVTVDDTYIEVHTGPGRGYPIFHVIERGEIIHLHKRRTDWIKVSDKRDSKHGWVKRDALNQTLGPDGEPLFFGEPGWDEYIARRWDLGVAMGEFKGADSLTLNLGYRFSHNISAEVRFSQATGEFSDNTIVNAAVIHQPFPQWRISPFFMLGAGVIETQPHATLVQTEDRSDTAMLVGAGAYIYLSRRFVMRLEYNNHLILTSRDENEEIDEWKLGFNVFF